MPSPKNRVALVQILLRAGWNPMTWFYVDAGQQAGPISDIQLDEFILGGKIGPDTLIWRETMENWTPCREVRPDLVLKARPVSVAVAVAPPKLDTPAEIVCFECNTLQPKDNSIRYGDLWICAACKPLHIQKLKEGVLTGKATHAIQYAGIGARALAKLLDAFIIGLPAVFLMAIIIGVLAPSMKQAGRSADAIALLMVCGVLAVALAMVLFQVWCLPRWGATPGKRILGLRVVTPDGGRVSWGRAFGRLFGEWVNGLIPFWIGYIIACFDNERRTVHDHIAGTRVIKV